jgi:hypothetical protein
MVSIEIDDPANETVKALVPSGTEAYLVRRAGRLYLNVRTQDRGLLDRLRAAAR